MVVLFTEMENTTIPMQAYSLKAKRSFIVFVAIPAFSVFSFYFLVVPAYAATGINSQINFQGKLVDANGLNVADGSYTVVFSLYSVASGGTAIWTETQSVTTTGGIFQVQLGSVTALPGSVDFNTDSIFLGIKVGADTEMTPRIRFAAVPYAFNAQKVAGLTVTNTTGTLTIPNGKTISFGDAFTTSGANALTLTTTGATNVTLPTGGILITNTAGASQTITSTQTSGTVLGVSDSTGLTNAITGQAITLSGTGAFDQTGLSFNLSGATGTNLNDIVGTGSSWKVSKNGGLKLTSLDLQGSNGTTSYASVSGKTSFASMVIDQSGVGDLLTTSSSGMTRFRMANNGSTLFQGDTVASIGTIGTGTPSRTNDYAAVNAIGDQGSMVPNAGFESNLMKGFGDGWVKDATSTATLSQDTVTSAKGSSSFKIVFSNTSAAIYSACFPVTNNTTDTVGYVLNYYAKSTGTPLPTVRAYLDNYASKSNCQSDTTLTSSAPAQAANVTTSWAQYGSGTTKVALSATATWARVHFYFACTVGCTNATVNLDGVRVIQATVGSGNDYAENYQGDPDNLAKPGDVVSLETKNGITVVVPAKKLMDTAAIGVVTTNPALVLDDGSVTDAKVPVALAGRIPTNVSTKNGAIHVGDYLTSSAIPGVAVKAISTGPVIGQAMEEYTESDPIKVHQVIMFVKNTYNGISSNDIAGLTFQHASQNSSAIQLSSSESFVSPDASGAAQLQFGTNDALSLTSQGKKGLTFTVEAQNNNSSSDESSVSSPSAVTKSLGSSVLSDATISALLLPQPPKPATDVSSTFGLLLTRDATVSGTLRVQGSGLIEGVFTIIDTLTTKDLIVNQLATFFGNVVFNSDIYFSGTPTFNADTAGYTTIQKGSDHTDVHFVKEYATEPVINATLVSLPLTDESFSKYHADGTCPDDKTSCQDKLDRSLYDYQNKFMIKQESTKGFEIKLLQNADQDMRFSWSALSVKQNETAQKGGE